jgi:hypothetical protein
MPTSTVHFRDLLHGANLRHGTHGFTSLPKEGMLRIFLPLKIRRLRPVLNPRTWVPEASTLTPRPLKPLYASLSEYCPMILKHYRPSKNQELTQQKNGTSQKTRILTHLVICQGCSDWGQIFMSLFSPLRFWHYYITKSREEGCVVPVNDSSCTIESNLVAMYILYTWRWN